MLKIFNKNGLIVLLILFLSWALIQNRSLKNQINKRYEPPDTLKPGDVIPFFTGVDINGKEIDSRNYSSKGLILFAIFRPNCPFCEKMAPFWNEMYDAINGRSISMIGITTGQDSLTQQFAEEHKLDFPILSTANSSTGDSLIKYYKINLVPILILVESGGTVRDVWPGYLDENKQTGLLTMILTRTHSQESAVLSS